MWKDVVMIGDGCRVHPAFNVHQHTTGACAPRTALRNCRWASQSPLSGLRISHSLSMGNTKIVHMVRGSTESSREEYVEWGKNDASFNLWKCYEMLKPKRQTQEGQDWRGNPTQPAVCMSPEPKSDSFEESDEKLRTCKETANGSHAAKTIERLGWFSTSNCSTGNPDQTTENGGAITGKIPIETKHPSRACLGHLGWSWLIPYDTGRLDFGKAHPKMIGASIGRISTNKQIEQIKQRPNESNKITTKRNYKALQSQRKYIKRSFHRVCLLYILRWRPLWFIRVFCQLGTHQEVRAPRAVGDWGLESRVTELTKAWNKKPWAFAAFFILF